MHTEKQKIFDEYAKTQGYNNWDLLVYDYRDNLMSDDEFNLFMFEVCDLVQKAQQDRIAKVIKHTDTVQTILDEHKENIGTMDDLNDIKARKKEIKEFQAFLTAVSSIKSEQNLIK